MDNILLIFICLLLGIALQKVREFPNSGYKILNLFIIYAALPGLALYFIPKIEISHKLLFPLAVGWIGFSCSFIFFWLLGKKLRWSKRLTGCLILTSGLGNTAFIGFPVIQALYGDEGLKAAIVVDQPGSFVVMATLGIITATIFSNGKPNAPEIFRKIITFPPFVAFVAASFLMILKIDFPPILQNVFQKLGSTVVPVALVSVGLQLKIQRESRHWRFLWLGLFFKLFITPAIFYVLYKVILHGDGLETNVSIMEAAMAPMITGAILASNYGLKPRLSSMMIGVGIPLSFLTLGFWYWILSF